MLKLKEGKKSYKKLKITTRSSVVTFNSKQKDVLKVWSVLGPNL
jgi:hypothetical protein